MELEQPTTRPRAAVAAVVATMLVGGGVAGAVLSSGAAAAPASHRAEVGTGHDRRLGTYLVDGRTGVTLYLFEKDRRNRSRCSGSCGSIWPAFTTSARPRAVGGARSSKIGRIKRGGRWQVTYDGHPLYKYVGDSGAGQTNGEGLDSFGARWYAMTTRGSEIH